MERASPAQPRDPGTASSPNTAPNQQQQAQQPTTSTLANAVINIAAIKENARKDLIDVLDSVRGKKGLVLDTRLSGPLGLIAEVSLLKQHGVEKIFLLNSPVLKLDPKVQLQSIIYIVRPKVESMKMIANQIKDHMQSGANQFEYQVVFVPRRTMICEKVLEDEGVYAEITFSEYRLDLIPFDDDVLSLELETSYRDCFLEGDRTSLFYVAKALMNMQTLYGMFPQIKAKGVCSKLVVDMLSRMRKEMGTDELGIAPEIDQLILIDRDVDLVTPLCTQLTYEGLIDEIYGINNSFVDVDPEILGSPKSPKKMKIPVNSNDRLYADLRDLNFTVVGPRLNKKAKEIDEYYNERHKAQSTHQLLDFMKRFASAQHEHLSLKTHTSIAENILSTTKDPTFPKRLEAEQSLLAGIDPMNDYIEDCIGKSEPILKILRLLCLQSLTCGGIKPKQLEHFKREIIQSYGYEHVLSLINLEKLGLIRKQESKNSFAILRKYLNLVVEDVDEVAMNDLAYVYSGYAPLSARIVEHALKGTWRSREFQEVLKAAPGPLLEETQHVENYNPGGGRSPVTLVFFIGGVTFTEISALRWLGKQQIYGDIIVGTTKLINGDTLLSTFLEPLGKKDVSEKSIMGASPSPVMSNNNNAPPPSNNNNVPPPRKR